MAYYNPHITGHYNPLDTLNNEGFFFIAHMLFMTCPWNGHFISGSLTHTHTHTMTLPALVTG